MKIHFSKVFVSYLLVAIVSTQFVLAQHSAIHFDMNSNSTQHDSDDNKHVNDICQTCVTAKNLTHKYLPQTNYSFSILKPEFQIFHVQVFVNLQSLNKPFRSQAPPFLFS